MKDRRIRTAMFIGAAVVLGILVAWAVIDPGAAAVGWLVGFVFWAQILIGSLSLAMIHRLTSGSWGVLVAPVIGSAAAAVPLLFLLAVPLFAALPELYPWTHRPTSIKPDVLELYLNRPAFIVRSMVALAGWSLFAVVLPRCSGGRGEFWAAIGLVFHAVVISSVSVDWYLSIAAPFTSSSFGASVAICSLVAALAWAATWMPRSEQQAVGDVGALLLATVLGLTYINFMAVLVIWYGDLPREVSWFAARETLPWRALAIAAFVLGSVIPIIALLQSRFRNRRGPLRLVAILTLAGIAAYDAYLIAPAFGAAALATSLLAAMGMGLILIPVTTVVADGSLVVQEPLNVR
jgi:hypothetical protein